MALEGAAAGQQDFLIPGIDFKLPQGASYISGRRFATFHPQGSNIYSPNAGTRLIRFVISDATALLDLSTVRLAYQFTNTDGANELWLTGHPGSWAQRVRIFVGGCLREDILMANRVSSMLDLLKPANRRWSESMEMLGAMTENLDPTQQSGYIAGPWNKPIAPNMSRTMITPIFAGIFSTHYLLPLRWPLTIEIELVNNANQCCAAADPNGGGAGVAAPLSQQFNIQNARILCDIVSVDGAVQEELSRVVLSGGALPLHFSSYSTTMHNLALNPAPNQSWSITISRAFSRIKSVFATFESDGSRGTIRTESNNFLNWHGKPNYNTYGDVLQYQPALAEGWRFQMTSGSLIFPDIPMSSAGEAFYQLSKVLGMHSTLEGTSIPPSEWLGNSFMFALDLEKASTAPGSGSAAFTGLSTRNAGDTIRLAWEGVEPRDLASTPQRCYVTIHHDLILELRAEGCVLLD